MKKKVLEFLVHGVASGTRDTVTIGFNRLARLDSEQTTFGLESLSPDLALGYHFKWLSCNEHHGLISQ